MRTTSPAANRTVPLSASRCANASSPPGSNQFSPTAPGSPPAGISHGCRDSAFGDQRQGRVLEQLELTDDAVASGRRARSAAVRPQGIAPHPHRVRPLERFDRRVARVRHRGVHTVHAGPAVRSSALAAPDRLVVHPAVATDEHVVHRSLRGPTDRDRARRLASAPRHTSATR